MGRPSPGQSTCVAGAATDQVRIDGIEVVQSVQEPGNSVTLVAHKHTLIRLYLSTEAVNSIRVRGNVTVRDATGEYDVASQNEVVINPDENGATGFKRRDLGRSLNIIVPAQHTVPGQVEIGIAAMYDAETGEALDFAGTDNVTVSFQAVPNLRLRLIGIRYQTRRPPREHIPTQRDIDLIVSWLRRAYPVADVEFTYTIVDANARWPFLATAVNAQLAAIRRQEVANGVDSRTHYYGVVADSAGQMMRGRASSIPSRPNPAAVASGPSGSRRFSWDTDGSYADWYAAHELAHTFGRMHPGFCGSNSRDDLNFPYPRGRISGDDPSYVGYDGGDADYDISPAALPGAEWHDVMTYCNNQWLSAYSYESIRERIIAEDQLDDSDSGLTDAQTVPLVNLVATINLASKTGEIAFVNPVARATQAEEVDNDQRGPTGSAAFVRLIDQKGNTVGQNGVAIHVESCDDGGADPSGLVDAVFPVGDDVAALELVVDDKIIDRFVVGPSPSDVSTIRGVLGMRPLLVEWDSAEANDPKITYTVQVSADDGHTWDTIAIGRPTPDVRVAPEQYPNADAIKVRVIATNGFRSAKPVESEIRFD